MKFWIMGVGLAIVATSAATVAYLTGQNRLLKEQVDSLRSELMLITVQHAPKRVGGETLGTATACATQALPISESKLTRLCSELKPAVSTSSEKDSIKPISSIITPGVIPPSVIGSAHKKYAPLISSVSLNRVDRDKLVALLEAREAIDAAPITGYMSAEDDIQAQAAAQAKQLAEIDAKVADLLDVEGHEQFNLLKDSSFEHYQLEQFVKSLDEPLLPEQKSTLLMTKLALKKRFDQQLTQLLQQPEADPAEALALLDSFRSDYYAESAAWLDGKSLERLRAFEDAQFDAIKKSLDRQLAR